MDNKSIELGKKLKALADAGYGGEKQNAKELLEKYLRKHNLTIEQIDTDAIISRRYKVGPHGRLFLQVVASVTDEFQAFRVTNDPSCRILDVTEIHHIETEAKFNFFKKEFIKQKKENEDLFFNAFVQKNALYSSQPSDPAEAKQLTLEERQRILKVQALQETIDRAEYLKQLSTSSK